MWIKFYIAAVMGWKQQLLKLLQWSSLHPDVCHKGGDPQEGKPGKKGDDNMISTLGLALAAPAFL